MGREYNSAPANFTETASTLTSTYVTIAANPDRRGLIIGNPSDTVMTFRVGGTASATAGVPIAAGDRVAMTGDHCPSGLVTVFCAGTSKAYCIYEW